MPGPKAGGKARRARSSRRRTVVGAVGRLAYQRRYWCLRYESNPGPFDTRRGGTPSLQATGREPRRLALQAAGFATAGRPRRKCADALSCQNAGSRRKTDRYRYHQDDAAHHLLCW